MKKERITSSISTAALGKASAQVSSHRKDTKIVIYFKTSASRRIAKPLLRAVLISIF